jgi:triacylglycerol esterase/lipase EstA (alpha/beta hydrolase family)
VQHVVLVPGFFGFANLGDFTYFAHVRDSLVRAFQETGVDGGVYVVHTWPTASLARRAERVLETVAELPEGDVHLIGHSTGGLDARLAVSPSFEIGGLERWAERVRSVLTLSAPHHGSPLAAFLTGIHTPQLLRLISLSMIYMLRTGRVPVAAVFHLVRLLALKELPVASGTLLNQLYRDLLSDFSHDRRVALEAFFVDVVRDQTLLSELDADAMRAFNARCPDRATVRYGSVVTRATPPGPRVVWQTGLSPFRQMTYALYAAFHRITAQADPAPTLDGPQAAALVRAFGRLPRARDNDGMVPTLSQVWGRVVHAAVADHLDPIGHFYQPEHVPPHFDWLNSGRGFSRDDYRRLWKDVACFLFST